VTEPESKNGIQSTPCRQHIGVRYTATAAPKRRRQTFCYLRWNAAKAGHIRDHFLADNLRIHRGFHRHVHLRLLTAKNSAGGTMVQQWRKMPQVESRENSGTHVPPVAAPE
jgi:hypothetical protein